MNSNLEFELKLRRAQHHLKDLDGEITVWLDRNFDTIVHEKDPERGDHFSVYVNIDPIPIDVPLLVGDILHNMRGTLDHLAYALTERHAGGAITEDVAQKSEFPIFLRNDKWAAQEIKRKIGSMAPSAQAIIQSFQPYNAIPPRLPAEDPLWMLHRLSNFDKHRLLLSGALTNFDGIIHPSLCENFTPVSIEIHSGYLER
ncbi:MAG: hypothetical protein QM771_14690 [Nitrospira sp.]